MPYGVLFHLSDALRSVENPSGYEGVTGNRRDSVEGAGWEFAHVAIDNHSRSGFVRMSARIKDSTVDFLKAAVAHYAALDLKIRRLLTDNGAIYRSILFARTVRPCVSSISSRGLIDCKPTARLNVLSRPACVNEPMAESGGTA